MSHTISKSSSSINEGVPLGNIIYKVKLLKNNSIHVIYVFYGKKDKTMNNEVISKQIFSEKEHEEINRDKPKIIFSEQKIHPDDSIATIKIKIINELNKTNSAYKNNVSMEELYLFCKKVEKLNTLSVYQSLTQNKKIN